MNAHQKTPDAIASLVWKNRMQQQMNRAVSRRQESQRPARINQAGRNSYRFYFLSDQAACRSSA
jgi:hypothetical protein